MLWNFFDIGFVLLEHHGAAAREEDLLHPRTEPLRISARVAGGPVLANDAKSRMCRVRQTDRALDPLGAEVSRFEQQSLIGCIRNCWKNVHLELRAVGIVNRPAVLARF